MGRLKIRYFVAKRQKGGRSLYYWQPSRALRNEGFAPRRLSNVFGEAIRQAEELNRQVDGWRGGTTEIANCHKTGTIPYVAGLYRQSEQFTELRSPKHRNRLLQHLEAWSARAKHPLLRPTVS
jgi:hypothetical protein